MASREQLGVVFHDGNYYVFGGASQQAYNDLKQLDPTRYEWKQLPHSGTSPKERFGHSLNLYRGYLAVFGGGGHFIHEIKRRHTYEDFLLYDTTTKKWFDPIKDRSDARLKSFKVTGGGPLVTDDD
jgi:hypothetical protein